jgi:lysozyme family protein
MAGRNFPRALEIVLAHEGSYVDHPLDPGGATNMGITRATLARWRGRPVPKSEVRALTRREAGAIYRRLYWEAVRADELPDGLDLAAFDYAVNSGVSRAVRALQKAVHAEVDGRIGPATLAAARVKDPAEAIRRLCAARLAFLERLSTWRAFGRGWSRRVRETEGHALALAAAAARRDTRFHPELERIFS